MSTATDHRSAVTGARAGAQSGLDVLLTDAAVSELARVAAGRSRQAPARGDRRFADPAWERNWLLRRLMQGSTTRVRRAG